MSFFDKEAGLFNPSRWFAFTNITNEKFVSAWDKEPIIVEANETIKVPEYLAKKLSTELIDKILIGNAKADEMKVNQPYYRSPLGMNLAVPAIRDQWEAKMLVELPKGEVPGGLQIIRTKLRQELEADMAKQPGVATESAPVAFEEFAALDNTTAAKFESVKRSKK